VRLGEFYRDNPDIDLEISATKLNKQKKRVSIESGEVDVALRYGSMEEWSGLDCVKLMDVQLFPVCSPSYRATLGGLSTTAELRKAIFLRLPHEPWKPWFTAAGLDWPEPASGSIFGDASLMLDAAASGQGIALARSVLVEHDLASGRLVRLSEVGVASGRAYFAVCSPAARARSEVQRFLEWLVGFSRRSARPRAGLAAVR